MATQTAAQMVIEVDGGGEPLVMIHGLGGTSNTFTPQMMLLASRLKVIRPDLPGSGRSAAARPLSIALFAARMVDALAALGIAQAHFIGHSMGAIVAFRIAVEHPGLVRSLALLGPLLAPAEAARPGIRERAAKARTGGMQPIADAVVQGATAAETRRNRPIVVALVREMLMRQDPEGYARTCEALAEAVAPEVSPIRCPTLLLAGDEDAVAPAASVRDIGRRIGGSRVQVLGQCGHWLSLEKAEEVTTALREFYFGRA